MNRESIAVLFVTNYDTREQFATVFIAARCILNIHRVLYTNECTNYTYILFDFFFTVNHI